MKCNPYWIHTFHDVDNMSMIGICKVLISLNKKLGFNSDCNYKVKITFLVKPCSGIYAMEDDLNHSLVIRRQPSQDVRCPILSPSASGLFISPTFSHMPTRRH